MCGIFCVFSTDHGILGRAVERRDGIERTIGPRGPDRTTVRRGDDFVAIHTLLSMTGVLREQPVVERDMLLLFNGEIYNDYLRYGDSYGDRDFLIGRVKRMGAEALAGLDGEYAICLRIGNDLHLATDPFGTKPLYLQLGDDHVVIGSYESTITSLGLDGPVQQVRANTHLTIDLRTSRVVARRDLHTFEFQRATKTTYDDWTRAFGEAIVKRTTHTRHRSFVSLSSGHDSGLIAAEMVARRVPFHCYTLPYGEVKEILEARIAQLRARGVTVDVMEPTEVDRVRMRAHLDAALEPYQLVNADNPAQAPLPEQDIRRVPGYVASALIHEQARKDHRLIGLSGQGADEIISDYWNEHSNSRKSEVRGEWAKVTGPWTNFFGGWNRVFLGGTERIAGLFGIETRYPFLDSAVVQEFLSLSPSLKSQYYKAPITNRLRELGVPFHNRKLGFAGFPPTP